MSLTHDSDGRPVHFPDKETFDFHGEVADIFPDMSVRSIPNFAEAHSTHARMLRPWIKPGAAILDVGSSRGAFLSALAQEYPDAWVERGEGALRVEALDNSPDMCNYLRRDFPQIRVRQEDLTSAAFRHGDHPKYDVVCVNYVLQFVPPKHQHAVMLKLMDMVKVGGALVLGHKSKHYGFSGAAAHEEYIAFRLKNGYTRGEIDAKTKALQGSMFPVDHMSLMGLLRLNFAEVTETFRFMMFSALMAVK